MKLPTSPLPHFPTSPLPHFPTSHSLSYLKYRMNTPATFFDKILTKISGG
ncbi:exonuclease SbcC [Microcystis sp. 0824]|nr:exonuclease SbcC [Microcystis sp. 0824]